MAWNKSIGDGKRKGAVKDRSGYQLCRQSGEQNYYTKSINICVYLHRMLY